MALNVKKGSFVANTATGNQAVSGVGFQPQAIVLWATGQTATGYAANNALAVGFGVSSSQRRAMSYFDDDNAATSNSGRQTQTAQVLRPLSAGGPSDAAQADLVSLDADGFTVNWVSLSPPAMIVHYMAFGGSSMIGAFVGDFTTGTGSGSQSVTGVGFQPGCVLFMGVGNGTGGNLDAKLGFGAAVSSSQRGACFISTDDNESGPMTNCSYQRTDKCIVLPNNTAPDTTDLEADFTSMDADGFTINKTTAAATSANIFFIAFQGGNYAVGAETQKTSTGTKATTGLGFVPSGLLTFGIGQTASASLNTSFCKLTMGGTDGTTNGCMWGASVDNVDPTETNRRTATDKLISHSTNPSTTNAEASLSSFDADGFTLDWTTADATAREFIYVAFGPGTASGAQNQLYWVTA
jgi:hypothetical protein